MKYAYSPLAFSLGASALSIRRNDQCCFGLTASGGVKGPVGQLSDGQNRIGQTTGLATPNGKYCLSGGSITDGNGRGCILTPPTTQFQCDTGATPSGGFSVGRDSNLLINGSSTFYACPTGDNGGYNIYTMPLKGQGGCVTVTLSTGGQCVPAPPPPSSSKPSSMPTSSAPVQSATVTNTVTMPASSVTQTVDHPASSVTTTVESSVTVTHPVTKTVEHPASSVTVNNTVTQPASPVTVMNTVTQPVTVSQPGSSVTVTEHVNVPQPASSVTVTESASPVIVMNTVTESASPMTVKNTVTESASPVTVTEATTVSQSAPPPEMHTVTVMQTAPAPAPVTVTVTSTMQPASTLSCTYVPVGSPAAPAGTQPAPAPSQPQSQPSAPAPAPSPSQQSPAPGPGGPATNMPHTSSAPVSSTTMSMSSKPAPKPSKHYANTTSIAPSSAAPSACATTLTGAYQTPHAIIPVNAAHPSQAYGTQYFANFSSSLSTVFNFDIPQSYAGKQCSVIFLLPNKADLVTSSFTLSGSGGLQFDSLASPADLKTSYANMPAKAKMLGSVDSVSPGNSYLVSSGACAAGTTQSIEISAKGGDLALSFFEDYNPAAIGLFITSC